MECILVLKHGYTHGYTHTYMIVIGQDQLDTIVHTDAQTDKTHKLTHMHTDTQTNAG